MKIYISHSREFDFKKELYEPIRSLTIPNFEFILPHEFSDSPFSSKELFSEGKIDLFIAEASFPSTGLGMELALAEIFKIPIIILYKKGAKLSGSLQTISQNFVEYENVEDLILKITRVIQSY